MPRLIVVATACLIWIGQKRCSADGTNAFDISMVLKMLWGMGYANRFVVPSRDEATTKLKTFEDLEKPITVQEFLGGEIRFAQITFYYKSLTNLVQASALLKDILSSVIIAPAHPLNVPQLVGPRWSEGTSSTIRALIFYKDGAIGRMSCDVTEDGSERAGGAHLFLEDDKGTYWWHRWDATFPRQMQSRPDSGMTAGPTNRPQRTVR
jgi:hypothetical protein